MIETFKIHKIYDKSVTLNVIANYTLTRRHSLNVLVDRSEKSVKKFSTL